ncbi:MAG: chorismate-binding protein [Moraxella osloensis]
MKHAFYKVQDYLTAGDCYQINLTQCYGKVSCPISSWWIICQAYINDTNAPFAGYLGLNNYELLSCSPELFLPLPTMPKANTLHYYQTHKRHAPTRTKCSR